MTRTRSMFFGRSFRHCNGAALWLPEIVRDVFILHSLGSVRVALAVLGTRMQKNVCVFSCRSRKAVFAFDESCVTRQPPPSSVVAGAQQ